MGNSWKAKCVWSSGDWKVGAIIEIKNGVALSGVDHSWGGTSMGFMQSFDKWCNYQEKSKWELITNATSSDNINPNHYKSQCSLECIDSMIMAFGSETVYYFCICNAWKYMWRYQNKNGVEDIKKARWYVDKASELVPEYLEWQNINHILIEIEMKSTERGELS